MGRIPVSSQSEMLHDLFLIPSEFSQKGFSDYDVYVNSWVNVLAMLV